MSVHGAPVTVFTIVVAVDVGKTSAMLSVTDGTRRRVLGPVEFATTRSGLAGTVDRVLAAVPPSVHVKVGVEAAGHYHRPVLDYRGPLVGRCVGSHSAWRMAMYLPGRLQNSHRSGGRVFLIFVADPRTTQLFRNFSRDVDRDTGRGRSIASLGTLMPT